LTIVVTLLVRYACYGFDVTFVVVGLQYSTVLLSITIRKIYILTIFPLDNSRNLWMSYH